MKTSTRRLGKLVTGALWLGFGGLVAYLLTLAAFSTTILNDIEHPRLIGDHPWWLLAGAGVWIGFLVLLSRQEKVKRSWTQLGTNHRQTRRWRRVGLAVIGLLGVMVVLTLQTMPGSDQEAVLNLAADWINKDFHGFVPSGYADVYPNQYGLTLCLYLGSLIWGGHNYLVWQLINVLGVMVIYGAMAAISDRVGRPKNVGTAIIWSGIFFTPLLLYTVFVYGTIWGLACALLAIERLITWEKKPTWRTGLATLGWTLASVWLKSNYLIFALGMIVWLVLRWLRRPQIRHWLMIGGLAVVLALTQRVANVALHLATGQTASRGLSSWSWIAMGLHESSIIYKGWWDGYNMNSYYAAEFEHDVQTEYAQQDIRESVTKMAEHPALALQFLADKTASQWNNPDFAAILINQRHQRPVSPTRLAENLLSVTGADKFVIWFNLVQWLILVGVWGYCWWRRDEAGLLYAIIVGGGFVFHLFWEGKSQYTLPYFALLVPLAVDGYGAWIRQLGAWSTQANRQRGMLAGSVAIVVMLFAAVASQKVSVLSILFYLVHDTVEYRDYVARRTYTRVADGQYWLVPEMKATAHLALGSSLDRWRWWPVVREATSSGQFMIGTARTDNSALIYSREVDDWLYGDVYLSYDDVSEDREATRSVILETYPLAGRPDRWRLRQAGSESYHVMATDNYALTYDRESETVYLRWLEEDLPTQRWQLVPIDETERQ